MVDWVGIIIGLVPGAIVAIISTVIAYARDKKMKNLEDELDTLRQHDTDLRKRRINAYTKLWSLLEPSSSHNRPNPVTYELVLDMWTRIREWYFKDGGIYLSNESREAFFRLLLKTIIPILRKEVLGKEEASDEEIVYFYEECKKKVKEPPIGSMLMPAASLKRLIKSGHDLRAALVEDIGTRLPPRYTKEELTKEINDWTAA